MELVFKPLKGREWISNAVVPVAAHVQLSVSYGSNGRWYVGKPGSYEAALQMIDPKRYPGAADLVSFESNPRSNVWHQCDDAKLESLVEMGRTLVYIGAIEVFDTRRGEAEPGWGIRFLCAAGFDYLEKLKYAHGVWGGEHRFIPAVQHGDENQALPCQQQ